MILKGIVRTFACTHSTVGITEQLELDVHISWGLALSAELLADFKGMFQHMNPAQHGQELQGHGTDGTRSLRNVQKLPQGRSGLTKISSSKWDCSAPSSKSFLWDTSVTISSICHSPCTGKFLQWVMESPPRIFTASWRHLIFPVDKDKSLATHPWHVLLWEQGVLPGHWAVCCSAQEAILITALLLQGKRNSLHRIIIFTKVWIQSQHFRCFDFDIVLTNAAFLPSNLKVSSFLKPCLSTNSRLHPKLKFSKIRGALG